jgi:hypothetical protein
MDENILEKTEVSSQAQNISSFNTDNGYSSNDEVSFSDRPTTVVNSSTFHDLIGHEEDSISKISSDEDFSDMMYENGRAENMNEIEDSIRLDDRDVDNTRNRTGKKRRMAKVVNSSESNHVGVAENIPIILNSRIKGLITKTIDPRKLRPPSYTDRILFHSLSDRAKRITVQGYDLCDTLRVSDHRAVSMVALLEVTFNF